MKLPFSGWKKSFDACLRQNLILLAIWKNLDRETVLSGIEITTEMATEMLLTNQAASALGTLIGNGSSALSDIIKAGDGARKFNDLPLNGQTLQALISYEALLADVQAATPQGINVISVAVEEIVDGTSIMFPPFMLMSNNNPGGSGPNNLVGSSNTVKLLPNPLQAKYKVPMSGINNIHPAVSKVDANKIHHILAIKHNWGKLVVDPNDWDAIARIMTKVLNEGIAGPYKSVLQKSLQIDSETVVVIFKKLPAGNIAVSDAWVIS